MALLYLTLELPGSTRDSKAYEAARGEILQAIEDWYVGDHSTSEGLIQCKECAREENQQSATEFSPGAL